MSDPKMNATPTKPKKRFRILLGVSLALNLLVVWAVVGALAKGSSNRGGPPGTREVSSPYVSAFDREDKRGMRKDMQARLPDRKEARAKNNADFVAFLDVLRADTFDQTRAAEIMNDQFERARQFQRVGRELSIERISAMSDVERNAYADRLQERLDNRKKRGKRKER